MDDDSVGEIISGSTGSPTNVYAWYNILFTSVNSSPIDLHDVVSRYGWNGIGLQGTNVHTLTSIQSVNCWKPIETYNNVVHARNILIHNPVFGFVAGNSTIHGEHITVHNATQYLFRHANNSYLKLTNSILAQVPGIKTNVTLVNSVELASDSGIFQRVGSGLHYLAPHSPHRNAGSGDINESLRIAFRRKTTFPPIVLGSSITTPTILGPVAQPDSAYPDLGFHYDIIDYAAGWVNVDATTLILTNGVAVAAFRDEGFLLRNNGNVISEGKPDRPNRLFRYNVVQAHPERWDDPGHAPGWGHSLVRALTAQPASEVRFRHTDFTFLSDTWAHRNIFMHFPNKISFFELRDCALFNALTWHSVTTSMDVSIFNNLFRNAYLYLGSGYNGVVGNLTASVRNNTHIAGIVTFEVGDVNPNWEVTDNAYAMSPLVAGAGQFPNSHNGYSTTARLTGHQNSVSFSATPYVHDNFRYFLPSNSPLIDAGSVSSAANLQLHHHTTRQTQEKEGITPLDIGVHYPATVNGRLSDIDFDGIADIDEDVAPDGVRDGDETDFANSDSDHDGANDSEERTRGTDPNAPDTYFERRLSYWSFASEELPNNRGELPSTKSFVAEAPAEKRFAGGAINIGRHAVDYPNGAVLSYREISASGLPNVSREKGTIRFWFRPAWASNVAPATGKLVYLSDSIANPANWWTLEVRGANLAVAYGVGGAAEVTLLTAALPPAWAAVKWHQVALTYDQSNVSLYIDGLQAATTTSPLPVPNFSSSLASLLSFGNRSGAGAPADGYFDEIETFNYAFSAVRIFAEFRATARLDDDNDGLSNITEVDVSNSDPTDRDTDNDLMSDGWEHAQNLRRPSGLTPFNLRSPDNDPVAADSNKQFEPAGYHDDHVNLQEHRLGLNPYRNDDPPSPPTPNFPDTLSSLISIKFGGTYSGLAAAGTETAHTWNAISASAADVPLVNASGSATAAKISLLMNLGQGTRFTVTCSTDPQQGLYCAWLGVTNAWANVFCCENDSVVPDDIAHYFCLHSDTGEALILSEQPVPRSPWDFDHAGQYHPIMTQLTPSWPWRDRLGLGLGFDRAWNDGWNYYHHSRVPVTTLPSFLLPALYLERDPNAPPPPAAPQNSVREIIAQSITPGMEEAWTIGFDQTGTHTGGGLAGPGGLLNTYLWNSLDHQLGAQPQSVECNDFWFTRDGHGVIKIGPLDQAAYRVYLYAAKPGVASTAVTVNGASVSIPGTGAERSAWREGSNYETVTVRPNGLGMIEIHFDSGLSLISAVQLMKIPRWIEMGDAAAELDEERGGVRVSWSPRPMIRNWNLYRQAGRVVAGDFLQSVQDVFLGTNWEQTVYVDPFESVLMGVHVRYLVQAVDDFGRVLDSAYTQPLFLDSQQISDVNHAPRLHFIDTLRHTYKDTPYQLSAARLRQVSDASDYDGDPIFFEVTEVHSGSLSVTQGQSTTTISAGAAIADPVIIDPSSLVTWLPAEGQTGRNVLAFTVRATDGALRSLTTATVEIEVRDDAVLSWWGEWKYGRMGNGAPLEEVYAYFEGGRQKFPRREDQTFTIDPSALLADPVALPPNADRRLVNVTGLAMGHPDYTDTRAALKVDGTVWTWGRGRYGTLGNGVAFQTETPQLLRPQPSAALPVKVANLQGVVQIAAGQHHMLALKSDGSVWAWGAGADGALGIDPILLTAYHGGYIGAEGGPQINRVRLSITPRKVQSLRNIVAVAAIGRASFAIDENGVVRIWGRVSALDASADPEVVSIPGKVVEVVGDALSEYYMALTDAGEVYAWGNLAALNFGFPADYGYRTTPTKLNIDRVRQIATARGHAVVVTIDGAVQQWGRLERVSGPTVIMPVHTVGNLRNIVKVATSGAAALAIDATGNVYGWGRGAWGVFGVRVDLSDAERARWEQLITAQLSSQAHALERTPSFGYFEQPLLLDNVDMVDDIAIAIDGVFASTAGLNLGPGGFAARALNGAVELSWRGVPGAASYELSRKNGQRNWEVIAEIPHDPRVERMNRLDSLVINGTLYEYRIRAAVAGVYGEYSRVVSAIPNFLPPQVRGLVSYPASRQVHLVWDAQGVGLDYEIWRKAGDGEFSHLTNVFNPNPGDVTLCDQSLRSRAIQVHDLHLADQIQYTYRVRARNQVGVGPFSSDVTVTPLAPSAAPPVLSQAFLGAFDSKYIWPSRLDMPDSARYLVELCELRPVRDPNAPLAAPSSFVIASRMVFGEPLVPKPVGTDNEVTLPLTEGRKYRIIVTEFSLCEGEGIPATDDFETDRVHQIPADPIEGVVLIPSPGVIYASWRGDAEGYMVELFKKNLQDQWVRVHECSPLLQEVAPDVSGFAQFMQGGLAPGDYKIALHALWATYAPAAAAETHEFVIPVMPVPAPELPAVVIRPANNRLRITWWGADDAASFQTIAQYQGWHFILQRAVTATPQGDCVYKWATVYEGPQFGVDDEEVLNGTGYTYRLFGISPGANPEVRFFEADSVVPAPTFAGIDLDLAAHNRNGAVRLAWNAVTHPPGLNVTYTVMRAAFQSAPYHTVGAVPGGLPNEFIDREVANGQTYYYRLYLTCSNGDAFESDVVTGQPSEAAGFLPPGPFTSNVDGGLVMLSWGEVPGASSYTATIAGGTPRSLQFPTYAVDFAVAHATPNNPFNSHFTVEASGRGSSASAYVTVVAWNSAQNGPIRYEIRNAAQEVVATHVPVQSERPPYSIAIARGSQALENFTVHSISQNGEELAPEPTSTATTGGPVSLRFSTLTENAVINSPTNIVVAVEIESATVIGQAIYFMQYFDNGALLETDTEPPFQFEWSNPAGSVTGLDHTLKARLVTQDWAVEEDITVKVKILPDLMAFQTAETDLQIPTPGLPLTASRSYDSRVTTSGMLGIGWAFDWERAGMTVPDLSTGWAKLDISFPSFRHGLEESRPHTIDVRLPDGSYQRFRPVPGLVTTGDIDIFVSPTGDEDEWAVLSENSSLSFLPLPNYSGRLADAYGQRPGPMAVTVITRTEDSEMFLSRSGSDGQGIQSGRMTYTADGGSFFQFRQGPPNTPDDAPFATPANGEPWTLSLRKVGDSAGNTVTRTPAGGDDFTLVHSNQRMLLFKKTSISGGHQWSVYDPIGINPSTGQPSGPPVIVYKVTAGGTLLTRVERLLDRTAATYEATEYTYLNNRLHRVIAPDGVVVLENTYDSNGLLEKQMGSMGVEVTLADSVPNSNGQTTLLITDNTGPSGGPAVVYGPGGELVEARPASGVAGPRVVYDSHGRPLYQIAPSLTDQNGEPRPEAYTHFSYDRAGRLLGAADGLGNQSAIAYDDNGNPIVTQDPLGSVTGYTYYEAPDDEVPPSDPNEEYNAAGLLRTSTDPEGTTTLYTYNNRGQVLTEKRTPAGGGVPIETRYEYYSDGLLHRVREPEWNGDPDSNLYTSEYFYDPNGNRTTEKRWRTVVTRDGTGVVTSENAVEEMQTVFTYDPRNRLVETQNPLGETSTSSFNAQGKVSHSYNTLRQLTWFTYDPRGHLIQTSYPNGTASRTVYDARGRAEWTQEPCVPSGATTTGPATKTFYDAQSRVIGTRRYANTVISLQDVVPVTESQSCAVNVNVRVLTGRPNPGYKRTIISGEGAPGPSSRTQFNAAGRVEFSVDQAGGLTEFEYDPIGRKTAVKRFPDHVASSDPTSAAALATPANTPVVTTRFAYDANGNQTSVTDGLDRTVYYDYDRLNRQRVVTSPIVTAEARLTFETTDVADWFGFVAELRAAADPVSSYIWNSTGLANALKTSILASSLTPLDLEWISEDLTTHLNLIVAGDCIWTEARFAGIGLSWYTADALAVWQQEPTDERKRVLNRLLLADAYRAHSRSPFDQAWKPKQQITTYDGLGRRIAETDEAGIVTLFGYDKLGRLTQVVNDYKLNGYNEGERPVVTRYVYDEVGNLRKEIKVEYESSNGQLALDTNKRPIESPTLSPTTIYEYDKLGRRTHRFLPAPPGVQNFNDGGINAFMEKVTYEAVGATFPKTLRKTVQDFRGETIVTTYDSMDRTATRVLSAVNSFDFDRTVTFTYSGSLLSQVAETGSGGSRVNYYAYDTLRRLEKKDTPEGVLAYAYDDRGSVKRMKAFRRPTVTVNGSVAGATPEVDLEYGYDGLSRLKSVTNHKVTTANVSSYTYDTAGNLRQTTYPIQVAHKYGYTEQNRLTAVQVDKLSPAEDWRRFAYTLNTSGQRASVIEHKLGVLHRTVQYAYDYANPLPTVATVNNLPIQPALPLLNRLTRETINPGPSQQLATYAHDLRGNRSTRTASSAALPGTQSFDYDDNDRLRFPGNPAVQFSYDANGNTKLSPNYSNPYLTDTDSYDTENRLIKRVNADATIWLTYDHDGNRVAKTVSYNNGTYKTLYYLVDTLSPSGYPQVVLETVNWTGAPTPNNATFFAAYEYGLRPISMRYFTGGTYYFIHDGHGSTRALASDAAILVQGWDIDYDAYGNTLTYDGSGNLLAEPNIPIDMHIRYAGEQWDRDLRVYYLRARYYSPAHGRFWTLDKHEGYPTEPLTFHKYLFCQANPVNQVDPSGEMSDIVSFTTGARTAVGIAAFTAAAVVEAKTHALGSLLVATGEAGADLLDEASAVAAEATIAAEAAIAMHYRSVRDMIQEGKKALRRAGRVLDEANIVPMPAKLIPKVAENISTAQAEGHPMQLTRATRTQAQANRREALKGKPSAGLRNSWDEYPFASSREGGAGSRVQKVPRIQNWIQGGIISVCYRFEKINPGHTFIVVVIP